MKARRRGWRIFLVHRYNNGETMRIGRQITCRSRVQLEVALPIALDMAFMVGAGVEVRPGVS